VLPKHNSRALTVLASAYSLIVGGALWAFTQIFDQPFGEPYQALALLSGLLAYFAFRRFDLAESWDLGRPGTVGTQVIINWLWVVAALMLLGLLTRYMELFARRVLVVWIVAVPLLFFVVHFLVRHVLQRFIPQLIVRRRAVIVFANDSARTLGMKLLHSSAYELLGYFDDREVSRIGGGIPDAPLLGKARDAAKYVRDHDVEVVFVVLPDSGALRAIAVIDELGDTTASLYYVPDFLMFSLLKAQIGEIESVPVLQVAESPFYGADGMLKRFFDFVFSLFTIIAILPVLFAVAISVKLSSPGPVLFSQKRYGLNGKRFKVYKFRSMLVDAPDAATRQATKDDERITRVGRFLRKTSLDELPQFFNVLKGEMSVVGPRPHTVAHNEHYRKEVRRYMLRHKVKPGITGWAQVNGLRGETAELGRMEERIRYDLEYIRHWSPLFDIKIILLTLWTVLRGDENAY